MINLPKDDPEINMNLVMKLVYQVVDLQRRVKALEAGRKPKPKKARGVCKGCGYKVCTDRSCP